MSTTPEHIFQALRLPAGATRENASRAGSTNAVWRCRGERGTVFVKRFGSEREYRRALGFYRTVGAQAVDHARVRLPALVSASDAHRALCLTAARGAEPSGDALRGAAAGRAVGDALRALRDVLGGHPDEDPLPLAAAAEARSAAVLRQLARVAPEAGALALPLLTGAWPACGRAWVHGDLAPRNLLLAAGEAPALIDFGQARPDHPLVDVCTMLEAGALDERTFGAAFLAAVEMDGVLEWRDSGVRVACPELTRWAGLRAANTIAWGAARGDATHVEAGYRLLERLVGDGS